MRYISFKQHFSFNYSAQRVSYVSGYIYITQCGKGSQGLTVLFKASL